MSRAYRVEWVTVGRNVSTRDEVTMDLALLGILPEGDMVQLLRDELARDGWTQQGDGSLAKSVGDAVVRLDPAGKRVTLELAAERKVTSTATTKAQAEQGADAQAKGAEEQMKREIARKLASVEPDVRAALDAAVQRVYVEALKKKAAQMGRVESVQETRGEDGQYEVTIKVRT